MKVSYLSALGAACGVRIWPLIYRSTVLCQVVLGLLLFHFVHWRSVLGAILQTCPGYFYRRLWTFIVMVSKPIIVQTMQHPTLIQAFGVMDLLSRVKTSFRFRDSLIHLPSPTSPRLSLWGFFFLVIISVARSGFTKLLCFVFFCHLRFWNSCY